MEFPERVAPSGSCDSHIHIIDRQFPALEGAVVPNASVGDYRLVQERIGTSRVVVVTPRLYVTDNQCTLDAISQFGLTAARGIAVVHPTVTDAQLHALAAGGICGIRFTIGDPAAAVTTIDMVEPLARRVNDLGWHVQLHVLADQIVEYAELLQRLAAPIVFDHMCRLPQPAGIRHPAFRVIRRLLDKGRTWIKLTGTLFRDSNGSFPAIAELAQIARAYIDIAPERVVWGSDWPHGVDKDVADDTVRFNCLSQWAPDELTWRRILVDNPEALYGFPQPPRSLQPNS